MLIKKAVAVRKHLDRNKKDKDSKFRLILVESRIHRYCQNCVSQALMKCLLQLFFRLARYYREAKKLAANWKYESATASALVA